MVPFSIILTLVFITNPKLKQFNALPMVKQLLMPLFMLLIISIVSCKKECITVVPVLSFEEKIMHKWIWKTFEMKTRENGSNISNTVSETKINSYMDFQEPDILEVTTGQSVQTGKWSKIDDQHFIYMYPDLEVTISEFTERKLVFYFERDDGSETVLRTYTLIR